MVVQGDTVAIRGRLEVNGAVKFQGSGSTTPGSTDWQPYPGNTGIYLDVDTSAGKFTTTPKYFTSLGGNSSPLGDHRRHLYLHAFAHGLSGVRALGGRQRPDARVCQLPPMAR